eukprot:TRINITY_DN2196_c0_g1_i1.p1 TRINITY_DN2196_c0_g1~~TRINITY_DN2196_c0_g1_i1.p1  ORF type:complete len:449 (+),score=176.52 TRINITY_DN2196_c0_g1_i1:27-1349(+)
MSETAKSLGTYAQEWIAAAKNRVDGVKTCADEKITCVKNKVITTKNNVDSYLVNPVKVVYKEAARLVSKTADSGIDIVFPEDNEKTISSSITTSVNTLKEKIAVERENTGKMLADTKAALVKKAGELKEEGMKSVVSQTIDLVKATPAKVVEKYVEVCDDLNKREIENVEIIDDVKTKSSTIKSRVVDRSKHNIEELKTKSKDQAMKVYQKSKDGVCKGAECLGLPKVMEQPAVKHFCDTWLFDEEGVFSAQALPTNLKNEFNEKYESIRGSVDVIVEHLKETYENLPYVSEAHEKTVAFGKVIYEQLQVVFAKTVDVTSLLKTKYENVKDVVQNWAELIQEKYINYYAELEEPIEETNEETPEETTTPLTPIVDEEIEQDFKAMVEEHETSVDEQIEEEIVAEEQVAEEEETPVVVESEASKGKKSKPRGKRRSRKRSH